MKKKHYQLYSMVNGKRKRLLATFYDLKIAKEIINTSMTSYDLALFHKQQNIRLYLNEDVFQLITQILVTIPPYKMPKNTAIYDDINLNRYHYLAQKFATLNRIDSENTIKNRFSYFIKMLKQDAEIL